MIGYGYFLVTRLRTAENVQIRTDFRPLAVPESPRPGSSIRRRGSDREEEEGIIARGAMIPVVGSVTEVQTD